MSSRLAFAKGLDEDDLVVLRRRLERLLVAVRDWRIARINGHEFYSLTERDGERPVRVDVVRSEESVRMKLTDGRRRTGFTIEDRTIGSASDEFGRTEQTAVVANWIEAIDAAFGFGVHEDRMAVWRESIDEARALCAAIVGSTGHRFYATLELAGGTKGFTLGQSDTGCEGGILSEHVNAHVSSMMPSLVVLDHATGGGHAEYGIESFSELPEDMTIDIDPDAWPDPVVCLRALSRMEGVPKPWTCIRDET